MTKKIFSPTPFFSEVPSNDIVSAEKRKLPGTDKTEKEIKMEEKTMFKKSFIAAGMAALMVIGSGNAALAFGPSGDGFGGGGFGGFGSGIESSFQGGGSFGGAEMQQDHEMQNSGRPEGTEMQEARPVDENGKAVLADGEELREPAEQLTGERPELPEDIQNGERPELPEGAESEMTEKGPGIDLMKRMRSFPPKMQEETESAAAEA